MSIQKNIELAITYCYRSVIFINRNENFGNERTNDPAQALVNDRGTDNLKIKNDMLISHQFFLC